MFLMRVVILSTLLMLLTMASAATAGPFDPFMGRWTGTGKFKIGSNSEGGKCVSTFLKGSVEAIEVNVRCAVSSGFTVDIKCNFTARGNTLKGPCQIRSQSNELYQVSGRVAGHTITGVAETSSGRVLVSVAKLGQSLRVAANSASWSLASTMGR